MQIQLDQITFDFDPERTATEPLRFLREGGPFASSEQEGGTSFTAEDFVITYARTDRGAPEIRIRLSSPDSSLARAEIQAIPDKTNVLGNIPPMWIEFDSGKANEINLSFPKSTLEPGVQHHTVAWEWQYRTEENKDWIHFQTTQHRVYCIFAKPKDPWKNIKPPEEVLKPACAWAKGAQSEVPAATGITAAVFALGQQQKVSYASCATYAREKFDLDGFLKFLLNGIGTSQHLNCDDCATIVSTFGNALGCDLYQSEMRGFFSTNFIRLIGEVGWRRTSFDRHAVAWKDACDVNNPLYDACLQIDADGQPNAEGHMARQPANLRFGSGNAAENEYKFCLRRVPSGFPCIPVPRLRKRRSFGKSYVGQGRINERSYLEILADRYNFESFSDDERISIITPQPPIEDFVETHKAFAGWKRLQVTKFKDDDLEAVDEIILLFPDKDLAQMVELTTYICAENGSPKAFFLQLLAQFNSSTQIRRASSDLIGAIVFAQDDETMHVIKYHQLIGLVRSVGKKPISTKRMLKAVEDYFVHLRSDEISSLSLTTATTLDTKDKLTTGEVNMPHKFATNWTCHLPRINGEDGLEAQGNMDLRDMGEDGRITTGRYYLPLGGFDRLEGEVFGGTPIFYITLREYDNLGLLATYDGILAHDTDNSNSLAIAGKRHNERIDPAIRTDTLSDQNDAVWVITKP